MVSVKSSPDAPFCLLPTPNSNTPGTDNQPEVKNLQTLQQVSSLPSLLNEFNRLVNMWNQMLEQQGGRGGGFSTKNGTQPKKGPPKGRYSEVRPRRIVNDAVVPIIDSSGNKIGTVTFERIDGVTMLDSLTKETWTWTR